MQKLSIEANFSQTRTVEIPVPFFARTKDESNYIALLDEKTVVRIYKGLSYTSVCNSEIDMAEKSKLIEAWETWHSCTETEFFDKYYSVIESISLHPRLAV